MNKTINYYNTYYRSYTSSTQHLVFTDIEDKFLSYLDKGSLILDYGCGSGRDSLYFLKQGYFVEAIDGSVEMVKTAAELTGLPVKLQYFHQLHAKERYDGIWACASILHCDSNELVDVFEKMILACKENGIIYASFKYGDFEGIRNERFFNDFNEEKMRRFLSQFKELKIEEQWLSFDVRSGRESQQWLNVLLRKNTD